MAWQEVFPLDVSHIDAEEEREVRLAAQARAGAEWAFAALVARYQPPVTRYLTRLTGDYETARMLAERIFVRMEKRLRGPHAGHQLRLWLLRSCTEAGLDALRHPHRSHSAPQLHGPRMAGLLTERAGDDAASRLRAGLGALAQITGTTSRQVRDLIWSTQPDAPSSRARKPLPPRHPDPARGSKPPAQPRTPPIIVEEDPAQLDPREALRYRMVRAVLAEIPYGDAQCLALHLIAGLNQAEVAKALGITNSATRKRIVQGLQLFAQRYEAAAASLGISPATLAPRATMPPYAPLPPEPSAPPVEQISAIPVSGAGTAPIEEQPSLAWDTPVRVTPPLPLEPEPVAAAATPEGTLIDGAHTLIFADSEPEPTAPGAEKTPIIVETTAVVDAIPVAELPVVDTLVSGVPNVLVETQPVALNLAAIELPAYPSAPEPASVPDIALAPTGEREPEPVESAAAAEMSTPVEARLVPVLTPAPTGSPVAVQASMVPEAPPVDSGQPAIHEHVDDPGEAGERESAAQHVPSLHEEPHPIRLVPVLTVATAQLQTRHPPAQIAPAVRTIPVLTPIKPATPASRERSDSDEVRTHQERNEIAEAVTMPLAAQDDTILEA